MSAFRLIDPDEELTYPMEWSPWLATDDAIASASWSITPSGPTVTDLGESGTVVSAKVEDCTYGVIYRLVCSMVSNDGETGRQSVIIRCGHT